MGERPRKMNAPSAAPTVTEVDLRKNRPCLGSFILECEDLPGLQSLRSPGRVPQGNRQLCCLHCFLQHRLVRRLQNGASWYWSFLLAAGATGFRAVCKTRRCVFFQDTGREQNSKRGAKLGPEGRAGCWADAVV